ncbi:MAG TPA: low affinity iron permease family protein [Kofleriaceae bacterium]
MMATGSFNRFAARVAGRAGNSSTFGLAVLVIAGWAVTGPLFGFSDTWQLVINTSTTIVTFLMVFLIQNTQNRDSAATQMKLDEIIRVTLGAHNVLLDLEDRSDDELSALRTHYADLARRARADVGDGLQDTGVGADQVT